MRAVAVLSLGLLAALVAMVLGALGNQAPGTNLAGRWPALVGEEAQASRELPIPLSYRRFSLRPETLVEFSMPLTLRQEIDHPAILVEGATHHLQIEWDGVQLASMGEGQTAGRTHARRGRLIVPVPEDLGHQGDHELRLRVRGDHGEGGILGGVWIAPERELEEYSLGRTAERLALCAMLAVAGVLGLVIASVRPGVREFLWFGVFCAGASANTFATDDAWWLSSDSLELKLRVALAGYALLPGSGLLFIHHILGTRQQLWPSMLLNAGVAIALFSLAWPGTGALPVVHHVIDIVTFVAFALAVRTMVDALRREVEGASSIALAVVVLSGASLIERLAEITAIELPRLLLPGFLLFIGTATAALVLRNTDLADRYRQLVASARDAILVVLDDGVIEEGNAAARAMLDTNPVGLRVQGLVHGEELSALSEHITRDGSGVRRAELHLLTPSGRVIPVESVATDLPEGRVMLVLRDLTPRRKVEEGMLHAARMETVGIIAGGIAHDFNNTMTALMAHIGLLKLKVTEEKEQERLNRMESVIRRAAHMTRRLLTLARGGQKDRRPISLAEPVHSAVELTRSMLPKNIVIKERIDPDLPLVMGSSDDLEQAVLNLLVNARDAMLPTGGTIRVRVRAHRETGLLAGIRVTVEDEGPGIPPGVAQQIWEPFFTTKGEGRGTGLGLSVVSRVIREHGGQIELDGRGGADTLGGRSGARFVITLPSAEDARPEPPNVVAGGPRRVLVVEDEDDIRELIRAELSSRGYRVSTASSAEDALRRVEASEQPFEVLVTDVVMGEMDGIRLAHVLCGRQPDLRVVIVSGFIPEHSEALSPQWQRVGKPFQVEQLATAIRRAMVQELGLTGDPPTIDGQTGPITGA